MRGNTLWAVVPRGGYIDAAKKRLDVDLSPDEVIDMANLVRDFSVTVGTVGGELTMEDVKRALEWRGEQ